MTSSLVCLRFVPAKCRLDIRDLAGIVQATRAMAALLATGGLFAARLGMQSRSSNTGPRLWRRLGVLVTFRSSVGAMSAPVLARAGCKFRPHVRRDPA